MPHLGIAVATTLGGWLNAGMLCATLVKQGHFVADRRLRQKLPRIVLSSAVMGVALWFMADVIGPSFGSGTPLLVRAAALAALVGSGLAVYALAVVLTGALDMRQLRGFLKRYSPAKAVLVSAVLFGAFHLNPWQFVGAAVLGTLFGWWYVQTRSLVPCLFGHALSNSLPLLLVAVAGPSAPGLTDLTGEVRFQPLWVDALAVVLVAVGIRALHRAFAAAKAEPPAETPEDAWA